MLITNKAQYTCHMSIYLSHVNMSIYLTCCTYVLGGGVMIFCFDKSTSLEGRSQKKPEDDQGGFQKMKGKDEESIIAHPLDKL